MAIPEQKNIGSGNINNVNSNNKCTVVININGKNETMNLLDVLSMISKSFDEVDKTINISLPNKVLVNKTGHHEAYQTSKIITSLLQLGIPLEATYEIAQATVDRIQRYILSNDTPKKEITTKDIRKLVTMSIQEMDMDKFSYTNIESWSNRYIRRYGHNNKRVQVYYSDSENIDDISFDYINNKLVREIVCEITKGKLDYEKLPSRYKNDVASEILHFVNRCDLYKINYDVLKRIIKEISIQPPHPWFISQDTLNDIMKYDEECLKGNLDKLEHQMGSSFQSVKIETLHHASALILEKYNFFLGCYDLSSFYLLKDLLNNIVDSEKWDLSISYSKLNDLLSDLAFSHIDVMFLCDIVNKINDFIKNQNINNMEFDRLLLLFGKLSLQLYKLGYKEDVALFLKSDWDNYSLEETVKNLKLIFYSLFPAKSWNLKSLSNLFWLNYKAIKLESYSDIKNQILVVYNDGELKNLDFLKKLGEAKTINVCNTIIVIGKDEKTLNKTISEINEFLVNSKLERSYITFSIRKQELHEIFEADNKINCLDTIISKQLYLEQ